MTLFRKKNPFSRPKFLTTVFFSLVIDYDFRIFPLFFKIFLIFPACNVIYNPFFTTKALFSENNSLMAPFFSLRAFARIRQHYFSKYWGTVPQSALGLRPC